MIQQSRKRRGRAIGRAFTASVLAAALFAGTCMSASAGHFITDPVTLCSRYQEEDGSFAEFKWVQLNGYVNNSRWVYIGPQGYVITEDCASPCPVIPSADGVYMVDQRIRSATGTAGQQPVFSISGTQKDLQYRGLRQTLDAIPLYPDATTGSPELDARLDQIFAQIITPDMDTHDKLKACYDYLIVNTFDPRYEEGQVSYEYMPTMDIDIFSTYFDAAQLFYTGSGVCDHFSAAFAVMAWKIGVPMYIVHGDTSSSRGGYTPHAWCQLDGVDGTVYIFDPHIDYGIALRSGKPSSYVRFGAPAAKVAGKYTGITRIFDKVI